LLINTYKRIVEILLVIIEKSALAVDMTFNTDTTVCMVVNKYDRRKIVSVFHSVKVGELSLVICFPV